MIRNLGVMLERNSDNDDTWDDTHPVKPALAGWVSQVYIVPPFVSNFDAPSTWRVVSTGCTYAEGTYSVDYERVPVSIIDSGNGGDCE